jgi:hypothetical protein
VTNRDDVTPEDAQQLLGSLPTPDVGDPAAAAFHDRVLEVAALDAELLAREALRRLRDDDDRIRVAALYALGRCAETGPDGLVAEIEGTLLVHAERAQPRPVASAVAIALNHLWNRHGDRSWAMQLHCAISPHLALRLAAAQALALSTTVPLPPLLVPAAERLAADPDDEVRRWAQDALSYRDGWPPE